MEHAHGIASVAYIATLQRQGLIYRRLCLMLLVLILSGIALTVPAPVALPEIMRGTRLEIVNDAGQVVLRAAADEAGGTLQLWNDNGTLSLSMRATPLGGRLEILDAARHTVFSVGQTPSQELPAHWEQYVRAVEGQRRELTQQQQELAQLARRLSTLEQLDRSATNLERQLRSTEDVRRELDQQQRELSQQRRLIDSLERQLRFLERR